MLFLFHHHHHIIVVKGADPTDETDKTVEQGEAQHGRDDGSSAVTTTTTTTTTITTTRGKVPLRRRAKAALLVALPVASLVLTVLPLVVVQTLWAAGVPAGSGVTAWVCGVVYFILPSLNPFLVGLTNRHLRHALAAALCCRSASGW